VLEACTARRRISDGLRFVVGLNPAGMGLGGVTFGLVTKSPAAQHGHLPYVPDLRRRSSSSVPRAVRPLARVTTFATSLPRSRTGAAGPAIGRR